MSPKPKENMFSIAAQKREQQQRQIEAAVVQKLTVPTGLTPKGKLRKRGDNATTMTLSCSLEDKIIIKSYAARHGLSVSDLLHSWIMQHCIE